jgi:hypothetical protein
MVGAGRAGLLTSLLLGHWAVPPTPPGSDTPFCLGQPVFNLDYTGALIAPALHSSSASSSSSSIDHDVEICGAEPGIERLPLYGKTSPGCSTAERPVAQMPEYRLLFQPVQSPSAPSTPDTTATTNMQIFPPSADIVQKQLDLLFFDPTRSLHIIGDSHQRYMYIGLTDLSKHNCSNTYMNPKYLEAHHLRKTEIEKWFSALPRPIHLTTDNFGLSKYDLPKLAPRYSAGGALLLQPTKSYNQTIYDKIQSLSACPGCLVVMNVGIHDMTAHTKASYLEQHPQTSPNLVWGVLEVEYLHNVEQFLRHVVQLGMKDRFVWVSGTPYEKGDTNWEEEGESKRDFLRRNHASATPKASTAVSGRRSIQSLSRWYRSFFFTKRICNELGLLFLDIFHPLSGPGFEQLAISHDVHKKRYAGRAKAALLLQGLTESFAVDGGLLKKKKMGGLF